MKNPYAYHLAKNCNSQIWSICNLLPRTDLIQEIIDLLKMQNLLMTESAEGDFLEPEDLINANATLQQIQKQIERLSHEQKKSHRDLPR